MPVGRMEASYGKCERHVKEFELYPMRDRESQTVQIINMRVT